MTILKEYRTSMYGGEAMKVADEICSRYSMKLYTLAEADRKISLTYERWVYDMRNLLAIYYKAERDEVMNEVVFKVNIPEGCSEPTEINPNTYVPRRIENMFFKRLTPETFKRILSSAAKSVASGRSGLGRRAECFAAVVADEPLDGFGKKTVEAVVGEMPDPVEIELRTAIRDEVQDIKAKYRQMIRDLRQKSDDAVDDLEEERNDKIEELNSKYDDLVEEEAARCNREEARLWAEMHIKTDETWRKRLNGEI